METKRQVGKKETRKRDRDERDETKSSRHVTTTHPSFFSELVYNTVQIKSTRLKYTLASTRTMNVKPTSFGTRTLSSSTETE